MKEILLIKNGEIALKGLNRSTFEDQMIKNIRRRLKSIAPFTIKKAQSTIVITPESEDANLDRAQEQIGKVFGIAAYSRAVVCEKNMEKILPLAGDYLQNELVRVKTFKVNAKRSDKSFAFQSPAICARLGEELLNRFPHLSVDVHDPDVTVTVEIRDFGAYIHGKSIPGAGGLPVGTGGRAAVLISGGIDSPVAAWMMAKRGLELTAVHFASPPYTGERALQKVKTLLERVAQYSGDINLHIVPFTEVQERIRETCQWELFTVMMRRLMMKIASEIASKDGCQALVTGESIGQVASQTIHAIRCTDEAAALPVFRPLIGMDKQEIIGVARKIDTFETSILPYEDCCTIFTPKHPQTRPRLTEVLEAEADMDLGESVSRAVTDTECVKIYRNR